MFILQANVFLKMVFLLFLFSSLKIRVPADLKGIVLLYRFFFFFSSIFRGTVNYSASSSRAIISGISVVQKLFLKTITSFKSLLNVDDENPETGSKVLQCSVESG